MTYLIRAAFIVLSLATITPVANAALTRLARSSKIGRTAERKNRRTPQRMRLSVLS